jgi:pre-mRNA-processing factor 6
LLQHGTEEKRGDVVSKCVLNEPKHGEVWQAVWKAPENAGVGTEAVLKKVAVILE